MRDYSQHREQAFILNWFADRDLTHGFYLDVGAHDGVTFSNTMALYEQGWRGVCVEPRQDAIERLVEARPLDVAVCAAAVCDEIHEVGFTMVPDEDGMVCSAACPQAHHDRLQRYGSPITTTAVPAARIDRLAALLPRVDFLSVDTEGTELLLLEKLLVEGIRPSLCCVEVNYEPDATVRAFAHRHSYAIVSKKPFGTINWMLAAV